MFCHHVNDDIQLKLLELRDADEIFALTDVSRLYLREWLPWVDGTRSADDSKAFIQSALQQFASNRGFREYGVNRIEIRAAVGNGKSRSIPERLGFQQEGICRQAEWLSDHFVDHVVYGMLAEDWQRDV